MTVPDVSRWPRLAVDHPRQPPPRRADPRCVTQFGEELVGGATPDHVMTDRYSHDGGRGDIAVVARDDASDALVDDRQHPLHLVQHMLWFDVGK